MSEELTEVKEHIAEVQAVESERSHPPIPAENVRDTYKKGVRALSIGIDAGHDSVMTVSTQVP